jgi:hypothetical protein|nr:MAG TPA: nucelotide kinase [Caudoviricetes sp.]
MGDYYKFGDAEVWDISRHLTGNAAQAVQYIARSCRLDGLNKYADLEKRIEDLDKARDMLLDEIYRLIGEEAEPDDKVSLHVDDDYEGVIHDEA